MNGWLPLWACWFIPLLVGGDTNPQPTPPRVDKPIQDSFVDVRGDRYTLPGPDDCQAIVLIFVGYDCPISNGYAPEVVRLCKEYTPHKVAFCVVYADADITPEEARQHAKDYGYPCPAILDPTMKLARMVKATVKPEAAVLSPQGELLYRGRINDLYYGYGKKRTQPTQHDLKEALNAILANKPVPVPRTKAVGCYIDFPDKKD
jgi:thiol-disulfide isomerase/thioredoxin